MRLPLMGQPITSVLQTSLGASLPVFALYECLQTSLELIQVLWIRGAVKPAYNQGCLRWGVYTVD